MQLDIITENEHFIALYKPSGLLSIPDREGKEISLKILLEQRFGKGNIFTVHRLDKDTSGLIMFAKNAESHKALSVLFEGREMEKYYVGLVNGLFMNPNGTIDAPIAEHSAKNGRMVIAQRGKPSVTDYEVLATSKQYSWVRFRIHTGRTHQIRIHLQHIGHSLVCDPLYGDGKPLLLSQIKRNYKLSKHVLEELPILGRLALHSHSMAFTLFNEHYQLEAPIAKDMRATLKQLEMSL